MVAPFSSELGVIAYEPKVVLIVLGCCLLILSIIKFFYRKLSWVLSSISTFIAVIAMVFLYPPSSRLAEPNGALRDKVSSYLVQVKKVEAEVLNINHRPKKMFDLIREKDWLVSIDCSGKRQALYIKEPLFGEMYSDVEPVCKK
ncbi:hypothetical protein [Kangiella koreensis]|uniref:Uncharacterized protein n=1 Tax=Kangiella koreensis (strain DSM 16069 / JCM 12317 / KCTC 12182 / SW-125) TaxID=523791 RepID=C7R650_KANKD|nr:hypothetical protein [Kangiella koreensis]ACV25481.1 hypothetical protein Kkor_0059 [Kangiella koreensis DSM 16069]